MSPIDMVSSLKAALSGGGLKGMGDSDLAFEQLIKGLEDYKASHKTGGLTNFLELSYEELKEKNLSMKRDKEASPSLEYFEEKLTNELREMPSVKAVMVCFSDLEGKLHILDYDKEFILKSYDNLTFDGSSITGFTALANSDLRLKVDWSSLKWIPSDVFGAGKVLVFGFVCDKDGSLYGSDYRAELYTLSEKLRVEQGVTVNVAPEIEGFLFEGVDAEQNFKENGGFHYATKGGYFNTLPQDKLRKFIDKVAEVQRALGFENEKDHPEVAPSQFEINFKYTDVVTTADQILLYKLTARQVAKSMGYTACFLPKPIAGINGSGMHTNMSFMKDGKNIFYSEQGDMLLSSVAHRCITGVLYYAPGLCLIINPSVNAYRRLDPNFEAPNAIKVSAVDRGSMIRVPLGNEKSARIEVRSVAPDVNPYLAFYAILSAGLAGIEASEQKLDEMNRGLITRDRKVLPGTIYEALDLYDGSEFIEKILGIENKEKYGELKREVAMRSPQTLGTQVKPAEVLFHHEIRNQVIWEEF
ncbi:MAG: glutamine synthetase family protein [Candidatus Peregrinibacteria bacterium]|nr:glutamine synthetase family protein [Candidatus Peregrinibacteria bacterium]MDZ4244633.1 glutamine synthetase family protein [Candidatus Gracilibacteria bacterium]